MRYCLLIAVFAVVAPCGTRPLAAAGWETMPSYFSHDPATGKPLIQYDRIGPFYYPPQGDYAVSGYRVTNNIMHPGFGSTDRSTYVESWGNGRGLRDAQSEREFNAWTRSPWLAGRRAPWFGGPGFGPPWAYGPGFASPAIPGSGAGGRGYGGPGYGGPGYGGPGYGGPGYGGPGGPGYGGPGYGGPGYVGPGYGGP